MEGDLIAAQLDDKIDKLRQSQKELEGVCTSINTSISDLKKVADKVALAAKAIGILADLVSTSATLASLA